MHCSKYLFVSSVDFYCTWYSKEVLFDVCTTLAILSVTRSWQKGKYNLLKKGQCQCPVYMKIYSCSVHLERALGRHLKNVCLLTLSRPMITWSNGCPKKRIPKMKLFFFKKSWSKFLIVLFNSSWPPKDSQCIKKSIPKRKVFFTKSHGQGFNRNHIV